MEFYQNFAYKYRPVGDCVRVSRVSSHYFLSFTPPPLLFPCRILFFFVSWDLTYRFFLLLFLPREADPLRTIMLLVFDRLLQATPPPFLFPVCKPLQFTIVVFASTGSRKVLIVLASRFVPVFPVDL